MLRQMTPAMKAHLQQEVTTLATCVSIYPTNESRAPEKHYTEHDKSLEYGGKTFLPNEGFQLSSIRMTRNFVDDNTELTLGNIDKKDFSRWLGATVEIIILNWQDTSPAMGHVPLFKGFVDALDYDTITKELKLTIAGMGKKLAKRYLPKYSRTCRTKFGDKKCGVPIFPVYKSDIYIVYPYEFEVGDQKLTRPNNFVTPSTYNFSNWQTTTGWSVPTSGTLHYSVSTIPGEAYVDIQASGLTSGDLLLFEWEASAPKHTAIIEQYDSTGEILEVVKEEFDAERAHNLSTFILPNIDKVRLKFIVSENQAIDLKPNIYTTARSNIVQERNKLYRIYTRSVRDSLVIPNGYFEKDSVSVFTTDASKLSDWQITFGTGGEYKVTNGLTGKNCTIEQIVELPTLSCTALNSNCYLMEVVLDATANLDVTIEVLDETNGVVATETFNTLTHTFYLNSTNADKFKVKITFPSTHQTLYSVTVYLYNIYISSPEDNAYVVLNSSSEKGTKNDIWGTETLPLWYECSVSSLDPTYPNQRFVVNSGCFPSDAIIGKLLFITGKNAGRIFDVRLYDATTNTVELFEETPLDISVGDVILLTRGCNKTIDLCANTYNNAANFRGEPFMPNEADLSNLIGG